VAGKHAGTRRSGSVTRHKQRTSCVLPMEGYHEIHCDDRRSAPRYLVQRRHQFTLRSRRAPPLRGVRCTSRGRTPPSQAPTIRRAQGCKLARTRKPWPRTTPALRDRKPITGADEDRSSSSVHLHIDFSEYHGARPYVALTVIVSLASVACSDTGAPSRPRVTSVNRTHRGLRCRGRREQSHGTSKCRATSS
jgi:hypothetical protein